MPRAPSSRKPSGKNAQRHDPLHQQLREDELTNKFGRVSTPGRRKGKGKDSDDELEQAAPRGMVTGGRAGGGDSKAKGFVDPKLSRTILELARQQQDELEREEGLANAPEAEPAAGRPRASGVEMPEDSDQEGDAEDGELASDEEQGFGDDDIEEYEELEIDPADRELLERFGAAAEQGDEEEMGDAPVRRRGNRTLADMIMDKIDAAEAGAGAADTGDEPRTNEMRMPPGINPKVIEVYSKVGDLLSRYKSGPLPKAFKIIPSLPAWEDILYITNPEKWTPHATLAATRIFVSNLKAHQTQRFFRLVLLNKIRDEIQEEGKASYQHYEALKKALYKPAAFFKGLLFPLCESGTLTLKEAAIVSSVLAKVSIPVLHSAAALLRLAEMEYAGPTSLFIRVLLDKKYALPYKVVDALVFHFLRFADPNAGVEVVEKGSSERRMPVLWHQSLLVFAQRYKQDLTPDQKTALLDLLRVQRHEGIGPEVRRELTTGSARGEMLEEPMDAADMEI